MKKVNQKGFTLAELLIVVAVIAVLVAVAIPTFANQLEKSRQAVDVSNLRGAYAAAKLAIMNRAVPIDVDGDTKDYPLDYKETTTGTTDAHTAKQPKDKVYAWYEPDTGNFSITTRAANDGYSNGTPGANIVADVSNLPVEAYNQYLNKDKTLPGISASGKAAITADGRENDTDTEPTTPRERKASAAAVPFPQAQQGKIAVVFYKNDTKGSFDFNMYFVDFTNADTVLSKASGFSVIKDD